MTTTTETTKAIRFHQTGGPEVLRYEDAPLAALADGEARVRHTAIGVNFIDCYHRSGLYPAAMPAIPGLEGVGVVEDVKGSSIVKRGDRVAYRSRGPGSYCAVRHLEVARLEKIPDGLADDVVAAAYVKGMTAEYLACRLKDTRAGHTAVVTAAAGGVGQMLVRVLRSRGVRVIAVVGSAEKSAIVAGLGVSPDDVIVSRGADAGLGKAVRARVEEGVDVVYDSVGKDTFLPLLDAVQTRGLFVSYGNASGPVEPFPPALLSQKGSLFVTRPSLAHWVDDAYDQNISSARVFEWLKTGVLQPHVQQKLPLADAAVAHRLLEGRQTTGSLVLVP